MIEAIIFDFDGVLVKSNEIRKRTYFNIFPETPERDKIVEECLKSSKTKTRWGLIEDIILKLKEKRLIDYKDLENEKKKYVDKYSKITEEKTSIAEEVRGSKESLRELSKKYDIFIVSGTTQESLDVVVKNRGLSTYFKGVYGTMPRKRSKIELIKKILQDFRLDSKKIIYIGDGEEDLETAKFYNMIFIGLINKDNGFEIRKDIKYKLNDLTRLNELIREIDSKTS
jgi:HAD superfamily hydrolase (TIGR01549 family)